MFILMFTPTPHSPPPQPSPLHAIFIVNLKCQVVGYQLACVPMPMARSFKVITRVILTMTFWSRYSLRVPLVGWQIGGGFIREDREGRMIAVYEEETESGLAFLEASVDNLVLTPHFGLDDFVIFLT